MQDYLLESLKLQRIDFFIKLVAVSDCSEEEKRLSIQWVSELTDELMAKLRSHEYSRLMSATEFSSDSRLSGNADGWSFQS
ncbi:hypothetical protein ABEI22_13980 [Erwinia billingiae]|uniref:hypothetical protein n=1 Tax=Erwinia billingiae TaxID=182337 RepID=UPI00320A837C